MLHRVYLDGTTTDVLHNVQTQLVPAGGGMIFDVTFHQKGIYPFVSHSFASVDMGEVGLVNVGNVPGTMSHSEPAMSITHPEPRRYDPAGAGSVAFLIVFTVLVVVLTTALWVTYFS